VKFVFTVILQLLIRLNLRKFLVTSPKRAPEPPVDFTAPLADLSPDQQKALASTELVFNWLNNMPSLDIVKPVVISLIEAANKLDGAASTQEDLALIAGWADDLMSFLHLTQFFARGHLCARAGKNEAGEQALLFSPTVLGKKYFEAHASMFDSTEETLEDKNDGTAPAASA